MNKKKLSIILAVVVALCMALGCNVTPPEEVSIPGPPANVTEAPSVTEEPVAPPVDFSHLKVAIIVTTAGLGDEAYNDVIREGVQRFTDENGIHLTTIEPQELQDIRVNCVTLGQAGYDLVVICENSVSDMLREVAPDFPDTHFVSMEGSVNDVPNVTSLQFRLQDVGFMCGAFSIEMSRAIGGGDVSAWIGGVRNPILEITQFSTQAGAAYAGGECKVAYVGSFSDVAKGKELALQFFNEGISIVGTYAGGANSGTFQAAESFESGKFAMGGANGQFHLSPERVIASNVKAYGNAAYEACVSYANGTAVGGIKMAGFEQNALELRYSPIIGHLIPEDVKQKMEDLKAKLISGAVTAPATQAEFDAFLVSLS
ncbi:MAG: BMP family ABC transporter substrate-binding protein [Clostridiales bacterium]|nr:BMP family ABC transporter substrate-binding protein [Clostridiales bacterium]